MGYQKQMKRFMGNLSTPITVLAAAAMLGWAAAPARASITNPLSAFPIQSDGAYTGSNPASNIPWNGEWSDITPAWFTSNGTTGATPVAAGTVGANSLLFAGLSRDTPSSPPELYLMYDYLGRTLPPNAPNQFLASITFPLKIGGQSKSAAVTFQTVANFTPALLSGQSFFDVFVSLDGGAPVPASTLGIEAGNYVGKTPVNALWGIDASSPFHTTERTRSPSDCRRVSRRNPRRLRHGCRRVSTPKRRRR